MRSGVKTVSFGNRVVLYGVIAHYVTLHQRVKIVTPRGIVEDFEQRQIVSKLKQPKRFCLFCKTKQLTDKQDKYCCVTHVSKHIASTRKIQRKQDMTRICKNTDCKKEFVAARKSKGYCCLQCWANDQKRPMITCKNPLCAKKFRPSKATSVFCCLSCVRQYQAKKVKS